MTFQNRKRIKDDLGNEVVMFFNEDFINDIIPLISNYTHHKISRVNKDDKRKEITRNGIVQINKTIELLKTNYQFDVNKFIEYGQERGKNWYLMSIDKFNEQKHIIPTAKKKFINPKKRKPYVNQQ
jgi:hypothetical protein